MKVGVGLCSPSRKGVCRYPVQERVPVSLQSTMIECAMRFLCCYCIIEESQFWVCWIIIPWNSNVQRGEALGLQLIECVLEWHAHLLYYMYVNAYSGPQP